MLARTLREKIGATDLKGNAMTSKHVDYDLKRCREIVVSSDGVINYIEGKRF